MPSDHGELEKYLGSQYARQLEQHQSMISDYQDAEHVLYGSMDVLSMFSKVNLAMFQSKHQEPVKQTTS